MEVALIIIYNHRYDRNIDILERIYGERFSNIYHLMPFYSGDKPNVIPVYEHSFYFQNYVAQGFKSYFRKEYTHYFFVADDMIINPVINEHNYAAHLKLTETTSFIPEFTELHTVKGGFWPRVGEAYRYKVGVRGVEVKNELPPYDTALQLFRRHGLEIKSLKFSQVWQIPRNRREFMKMCYRDPLLPARFVFHKIINKKYKLPYPVVGSYSDIFVVSSDIIKQFCHYCGVFAATKLFVEVAIPTAMVLCTDKIVTEKGLELQGKPLWSADDFKILEKYDHKLSRLLSDFPAGRLYVHPIKLSKWDTQL